MLSKTIKRGISCVLYCLMLVSLLSVSVFAVNEAEIQERRAEDMIATVMENPVVRDFQERMDDMLLSFLGSSDVTPEEVPVLAAAMAETALSDAWWEIMILAEDMNYALEDSLMAEAEAQVLVNSNPAMLAFSDYVTTDTVEGSDINLFAADGNWTPVTGVNVIVSGATDNSISNGAVTVTAKGAAGVFGIGAKTKTATVTIYNKSEGKATVSFDWRATSVNELKIDGTTYTGTTGSFSKLLEADTGIVVTITTAKNNTVNTLVMNNFSCVAAADSSSVTVDFNSNFGSVTENGTTLTPNSGYEIKDVSASIKLVATPKSGYVFVGWTDVGNKLLSIDKTYENTFANPTTIKAVFSKNAMFLVNNVLYSTLHDAVAAAQNGSVKNVILANTGALPVDTYNIPAGVNLVIPYSDNATSNSNPLTDPDRIAEKNAFVAPTAFRTLTVPANATINCAGNIRVDGRQYSASTQYTGHVYGAYGKIDLAGTINLAGGSSLRTYGYITGTGTVNASSTATVYELFQMADWRGGNNTSGLYQGMKGDSFLISCFYVQNIESNLVMNSGASLTAHVTIAAGLFGDKDPYNSTAKLIASDGLFQLASGAKLTRSYSGGRMTYKVEGDSTMGSISLNLHTGIGSFNMNSNEYILNLPSSMTIQFASGTTTIPVKAKMIPGAVIQIDSGATVKLTGSSELVIYDRDDWTSGTYTYTGNFNAVKYAVGSRMTSLPNVPGQLIVNGTLEVNDKAAIYSTNKTNPGNGNAGLSGTGKIVINGTPDTARTTVKEVTGSNQTTTTIAVVPLLAKVSGVSNTPTTSLSVGKTYFGVGDNYWCAHDIIKDTGTCACGAQFAAYVVGKKAYSLVDDALGESVRGDTVKIYVSDCTLSGTAANPFDLNGRKIEGTVAVSGTIIDSATNAYNASDAGYIKTATGTVATLHSPTGGAQAGKHYIKVTVDGTTQFHRAAVSVTGIQFYKSGESYNAIFRGHYKGTGLVPSAVGFDFTNMDQSVTSVSNPTDKNSMLSSAFEFFYGKDAVQSVSKVNATAIVSGQTITSIDRDVAKLLETFPNE